MSSFQQGRDEQNHKGAKKAYGTPHLQIYGDLRRITQQVAKSAGANSDGVNCSGNANCKTH